MTKSEVFLKKISPIFLVKVTKRRAEEEAAFNDVSSSAIFCSYLSYVQKFLLEQFLRGCISEYFSRIIINPILNVLDICL